MTAFSLRCIGLAVSFRAKKLLSVAHFLTAIKLSSTAERYFGQRADLEINALI